jgi:hypothetical protein
MVTALFNSDSLLEFALKLMDPILLQQFRQQLASWIETRLESQRLPFQRLEICPETLTDQGPLVPDLVLWINRDSQLAGSMILLPNVVNDQLLAKGVSLSRALGLGHFTTWAAHEVSIWEITSGNPLLQESFSLPPASRVTPEDFQQTLDDLLERLKIITVTCVPPKAEYSIHYFANLCLRTLRELDPGLTISARMAAGQTAADKWVELAPREKAWMSLWRMLFLLWQGRLPPGLQPERLEFAIHYALTDLTKGQLSWLDIQDDEPPLPEGDSVRLHHLTSRLSQLGWPHSYEHTEDLICLLLEEAARSFSLESSRLPWSTGEVNLYVACQPSQSADSCSLVAPRAYLAGVVFKASLQKRTAANLYAETLQSLGSVKRLTCAIAIRKDTQPLNRKECAASLILLRRVWPSRRFDLPRKTPAWLWDALYLAGLISDDLSLTLPQGWHRSPGILVLWSVLTERYQLVEISISETGPQSLRFVRTEKNRTSVHVHRNSQRIEVPCGISTSQRPGTTQVWLKASEHIVELLCNRTLTVIGSRWPDWPESQTWGTFIFLQTQLGRHLWALCSDKSALPEFNAVKEAILTFGMPLPNEIILSDLSLIGSADTHTVPEKSLLEREFASIFGPIPNLPTSSVHIAPDAPKTRRRSNIQVNQIASKVFLDGLPRFPEHYLMHLYRPELAHYDLHGPVEIAEDFFDRISLKTIDQVHTLEVYGKVVAEALILASYAGEETVSLPEEERILEEIVLRYRFDLERLWDNLIRECRRFEPHRQAAIKLARRIWKQQGLPPEDVFN